MKSGEKETYQNSSVSSMKVSCCTRDMTYNARLMRAGFAVGSVEFEKGR